MRHVLDVMHIENNIAEFVLKFLFGKKIFVGVMESPVGNWATQGVVTKTQSKPTAIFQATWSLCLHINRRKNIRG